MQKLAAAAAILTVIVAFAAKPTPAQTILYTFTGLPGSAAECKWFDDNITDRSVGALKRQTDLLFNRVALPAGEDVAIGGTAMTEQGEALVDFHLRSRTICTAAEAIYGPTPSPSP